jgi:endogenous inhibitor of DNA gyrase (YacG/DUF329 family)
MIASADPTAPRSAPCPVCGKPASGQHLPFCSARCRNIDLGRWLKGNYRIETDEGPDGPTSDEAG